jgi:peptidyl-prolyl cis-trans isomerase SurA
VRARVLLLLPAACLSALLLAPLPAVADTFLVDRIVAVVEGEPILLSTFRTRARPFQAQLGRIPEGPARDAAAAQLDKELLGHMIDDELVARLAAKEAVSVADDEVERALGTVAASNQISKAALLRTALEQGLTEGAYRDELRRQILMFRMVRAHVMPGIRITDEAIHAKFAELQQKSPETYRSLLQMREAVVEQVRNDLVEKGTREWLDELRRRTHVEIRL